MRKAKHVSPDINFIYDEIVAIKACAAEELAEAYASVYHDRVTIMVEGHHLSHKFRRND